jgi:hypothetical protein
VVEISRYFAQAIGITAKPSNSNAKSCGAYVHALRRSEEEDSKIKMAQRIPGTMKARRKFFVRKADLPDLRKFIETTVQDKVSDEMRQFIEREWPDLVHRLPPR